jgi:hypothetical protein
MVVTVRMRKQVAYGGNREPDAEKPRFIAGASSV